MPTNVSTLRVQFFDFLFGKDEGYLCICTRQAHQKETFKQQFFQWPEARASVGSFIDQAMVRKDVWFCPSLLERAERKKEFCLPSEIIYADLDTCNPETVQPTPTIVLESSPHRFQAMWRVDQKLEPHVQEDYNKRIAYKYNENGADPSGWDLTQLLRVPYTFNYKYETEGKDVPEVKVLRALETKVPTALFHAIERPKGKEEVESVPTPDLEKLPSVENVIYKFAPYLRNTAFNTLYLEEPKGDADWSRILWRLINVCLESGMSTEEVFAVSMTAKCNKYVRDNRPPFHLWQDILRADVGQRKLTLITGKFESLTMPQLVKEVDVSDCFIEKYKEWAVIATDAVEQFHEVSAAILLSSMCASGLRLATSYDQGMVPNLWGLILGDSTLTRKTTAMRMAMDIIADIDPDILLATDGSAEGLLSGLSTRPYRTSIFYKDEVSGFVDSINRKDYLAGMPETLTQLYDVPRLYTRRLRKETITISSPVFIFFGGGIRDKVYSLLTDEYVLSGFLPRFLVVSGEADLSRIRRTGPATSNTSEKRANLLEHMKYLYEMFTGTVMIEVLGQAAEVNKEVSAELTDAAWQRYGDIEFKMVEAASSSEISMLALPTFERMSRSLLKLSVLLAAAKGELKDNKIIVEVKQINEAAYYIQRWGTHTIDMLHNTGKGQVERKIEKVLRTIERYPDASRSKIMQAHNLTSKDANEILGTLEDRGQIMQTRDSKGKGTRLRAL